ncbi:MAG: hypothetical protein BVN35_14470 [Proteobacteria bacterium ST_bin11]|nr:MAG: hypothetical protein BVN35_14470 [Proteobacteria bacterium ST_bin11]
MTARDSIQKRQVINVRQEDPVVYDSLVVAPSRERFLDYQRRYPDILARFGIDESNYLRKPNGVGDDEGFWVYPDFPKDVWDMNVNRDMTVVDDIVIFTELDFRYIRLPSRSDPITGGYTNEDGVYPPKYLRLWDFLYNQEHYLDPSLTRQRSKPFPVDVPSSDPIVPDMLADTTMPDKYSNRYPHAAWETAVYPRSETNRTIDRVSRRRAQRFTYLRAHGERTPQDSLDAFNFEPHDATRKLPYLFRAFKSPNLRQSPLPYNPIVLRGIDEYSTNGWLSFYRQVIQMTKNVRFAASNEVWEKFIAAKNALETRTSEGALRTIPEAVFYALAYERNIVWTNTLESPDPKSMSRFATFVMPLEMNVLTKKYVKPSPEKVKALATINLVLELLRQNEGGGEIVELVYDERDKRPVFYDQPYYVVTIQVVRPSSFPPETRIQSGVVFNTLKPWTLSVPPLLNDRVVGELGNAPDQITTWYTRGENVVIANVPEITHQATVEFVDFGEWTIFAETPSRNLRYEFRLEAARLTIETIEFSAKAKSKASSYYRMPLGVWSGLRFSNTDLVRLSSFTPLELERAITNDWDKVKRRDRSFFVHALTLTRVQRILYFQGHRQFFWAINELEVHSFYLFVFTTQTEIVRIERFGDTALLHVDSFYWQSVRDEVNGVEEDDDDNDNQTSSTELKAIKWINPRGRSHREDGGKYSLLLDVVLPRQLGRYIAELTLIDRGRKGKVQVVYNVELAWPFYVPRENMERSWRTNFDRESSQWVRVYGVREDAYLNNSALPGQCDRVQLVNFQSLRLEASGEEEFPFFKAAIRSFALWYNVDVQNYALVFPWLVRYCVLAQGIVERSRGRLGIADDSMLDDVAQLLPAHLNPPLLMVKLDVNDGDSVMYDGSKAVFIVYDPVQERWFNVFSFDADNPRPLPKKWTVPLLKSTRRTLKESYLRCSPAYVEGRFSDERKRVEKLTGGESAVLAQRYKHDRLRYQSLVEGASVKSTFINNAQRSLLVQLSEVYAHFEMLLFLELDWRLADDFEVRALSLINYLSYLLGQLRDYQRIGGLSSGRAQVLMEAIVEAFAKERNDRRVQDYMSKVFFLSRGNRREDFLLLKEQVFLVYDSLDDYVYTPAAALTILYDACLRKIPVEPNS